MSTIRYTSEVGRKFHPDGSARRFPGNTIICPIPAAAPLSRLSAAFQAAVGQTAWGARFALLPPSSFHMTVIELLCDQVRHPERWSSRLPLDAPLAATDAFFLERVPPIPAPAALTVTVDGLYHARGLMLTLQPADPATAAALRDYREAVAQATGVRLPNHERYGFHMTLAYRLVELEPAEEADLAALAAAWLPRLRDAGAAIALPPPQLSGFDDMTRFVPLAHPAGLASR